MSNKFLLSILCISSATFSMIQLDKKSFKNQKHLGSLNVFHKGEDIFVQEGNKNPVMVNMLGSNLKKCLSLRIKEVKEGKSYLNIDEINGQYKIELREKIKGGGPILAWWGYVVTKSLLYGIGIVGLGTGVAATGGVLGGVTGGLLAATSAGGTGAAVIAGAIAGTGSTALAGTTVLATTTAAVTSGGCFAMVTGGIEVVSMGVGGLLALIPFL